MKLLECHVDNFGRLSNFDYQFSDGLTVIQEPNGFGKSTLAAFIKAMLYGFPRTAGRNIASNERKKYLPWQGGTYGGSLDFEFEGISYRVWRTFGKTAAKDRFSLRDLTNRSVSTRFTEKLGEELFQLDAESFMRSVYMPQMQNQETAATTSIQTKLSNLVDNTDDLNNYDSAMDHLRTARSEYRKFRGSGGHIDDIQTQIERLEQKLTDAETKKYPLAEATGKVEALNAEKAQKEEVLSALREKITKASAQQASRALCDQFTGLEKELHTVESDIQALDKSYPNGYPSKDEVHLQSGRIATIQQAQNELNGLVLKEEDVQCEAQGREIFSDAARTNAEIQQCQRNYNDLSDVAAKANIQMSKEELEQRETLRKHFQEGAPTTTELDNFKNDADTLVQKHGELNAQQLTEAEAGRLSELSKFFAGKNFDEEELTHCEEAQRKITECQNKINEAALSETEENEWKRLSRVFSIEVPEDEAVQQKQNDCRRIDELNSKRETKTTVLQPIQKQETTKSGSTMALIAVGTVLIVAGVICFVLSKIAVGAVLSVVGFAVLLVAFWTHTKQMVNRGTEQVAVESSAISEAEIQELYTLQKNVAEFLMRFYEDASEPNVKLINLLLDKKAYLQLQERKSGLESEKDSLRTKIDAQQNYVQEVFGRYYPGEPYQERFVMDLRTRWHEYGTLQSRQKDVQRERERLSSEIGQLEDGLKAVLEKYHLDDNADDILTQLRKLDEDAKELSRLDAKWKNTKEGREKAENQKEELTTAIEAVLKKYHVFVEGQPYNVSLESLRNNLAAYKTAEKNVADYYTNKNKFEKQKSEAEEELEQFARKYGFQLPLNEKMLSQILEDTTNHSLKASRKEEIVKAIENFKKQHTEFKDGLPEARQEQEELPAVSTLISAENIAKGKLNGVEESLQAARDNRKKLLQTVEQIPEMEDQLKRLMEQREEAEQNCSILDATLNLLETAKNNLSNQYVGGVERNFAAYVHELLGDDFSKALVDHDLTIHVDEKGEAREIDYFSAGTVDSVMLCMRLALIDALFKQEKPFVLLDDPFVNLDDEHTERALEMLKEIAKNKQVVYMVCNSSRC